MIIIPKTYFSLFEQIGDIRSYTPGDLIYRQNDTAKDLWLIILGRVRVYTVSQEGKEHTFEVLKSGRIFGDHSFVKQAIRNVNIQAVVNTKIIHCSMESLLPILHDNEELMLLVFQHITETSEYLMHQIERLVYYSADMKVMDFLVQMSESSNHITYSHQEIADSLGLNRVTVTRVIQQLKKQNILETGYGMIRILDRDQLKNKMHRQDDDA